MEETKSVIKGEFDRSGQYDSGLKSLVKSLQWAFAFLLWSSSDSWSIL